LQHKLGDLETDFLEINSNSERLLRSYSELLEFQLVLQKVHFELLRSQTAYLYKDWASFVEGSCFVLRLFYIVFSGWHVLFFSSKACEFTLSRAQRELLLFPRGADGHSTAIRTGERCFGTVLRITFFTSAVQSDLRLFL
jgi:hypothetical protein